MFKQKLINRFPSLVIVEERCMMAYDECFTVTSDGKDSKGFPLILLGVHVRDRTSNL
jgi:hypothetical protein